MKFPWVQELWAVSLLVLASLFLGLFLGHVPWILAAAFLAYGLSARYPLSRLHAWIVARPAGAPPDFPGAAGQIAREVYRREREMERHRHLMADGLQ
ncbi:MAG: DUF3329 domain-containing protein, partial [Acidiferrobacteraceae bacterium]